MHLKLTLSPSLVQTPCWTTPNSPTPNSLLIVMESAGIICLLGTRAGGRFSYIGFSVSCEPELSLHCSLLSFEEIN